jgi:hypothetical protein
MFCRVMATSVANLIGELKKDAWRDEVAFSPEIREANDRIWRASDDKEAATALGDWLQRFQPCLFGKIAAKARLLTYCILGEADLAKSDEQIASKIQDARLAWLADAFDGNKSGFVILAASPTIAAATPDKHMLAVAMRLAFLYLQEDIHTNHVHLDEIQLHKPGQTEVIWRWHVGVNYFSAQGDGRWWRDHRIPGGMGFSMNSVGHMVKAARLAAGMKQLEELLEAPHEDWDGTKAVDSLAKALVLAMRTIDKAAETPWGPATQLLSLSADESLPKCPFELPPDLANKNCCEYRGYYHTDFTIPAEYFAQAVERPGAQQSYPLDFTYLFHRHLDNPSHETMGRGRRVKADAAGNEEITDANLAMKDRRVWEEEVLLKDCPRLQRALQFRR